MPLASSIVESENFLVGLAEALVADISSNKAIRRFASNSDVIGAYAEASVRQFVKRVVSPLSVSRGAVISPEICRDPKSVPQIDTIIWSPSPVPAVFNVGDFGLVPRGSVFAVLEIKSSVYKDIGNAIDGHLGGERAYSFVNDVARAVSVGHVDVPGYPGLGVACVRLFGQTDAKFDELRKIGRAVLLFEQRTEDGDLEANAGDVLRFINFLALTRLRAKIQDGNDFANAGLVADDAQRYFVFHPGVPVFIDQKCSTQMEGVLGVILDVRTTSGKHVDRMILPTRRIDYKPDARVSWDFDYSRKYMDAWYRDPNTRSIVKAWDGSAEFCGADLSAM